MQGVRIIATRESPDFLSAGTLKGDKVVNRDGEDLGKIEEFMIDFQDGRVAYAVISFGGFLGMGDKLFAIPWLGLQLRVHEHVFLLDVPKETLKEAEGFDKGRWPLTYNELLRTYTYYGYQPYWQTEISTGMRTETESERMLRTESAAVSRENPDFLSASTLKGDKVINTAGEDLGKIEEIMIDLSNGKVAYAVLSFGGFLGLGDKLFAIPWQALQLRVHEHAFTLNVSKETLERAEGFDKDNWPITSREWLSSMYSYYGYQPYWLRERERVENRPGNI
jgi:sporulation protein YlmC with PRC-barrel domain